MSKSRTIEPVEFIRLNGHAVRATSWKELEQQGAFRLVAIVRGSGDANALATILDSPGVELEVPGQQTCTVSIRALERRDTGSAPAKISRFTADLVPQFQDDKSEPEHPSLEDRIAALETQVARLQAQVSAMSGIEGIPRFDLPT